MPDRLTGAVASQGLPMHARARENKPEAACGKPAVATAVPRSPRHQQPLPEAMRLQASIGNQAVLRLQRAGLEIGAASDPLEAEADRAADRVMRMASSPARSASECACAGSDEPCAACGSAAAKVQRKASGDGVPAPSASSVGDLGPGRPLDASTRALFEPRFGHDFGDVRLHVGGAASASASALGALAYTVGRDVVFGADQFDPVTARGQHLIAHELAHVVQQASRRPIVQRMLACPASLADSDPVPPGWKAYFGGTGWFHCGFRVILEDRRPTRTDPMNECVYDHSGRLVDENHPYAGCRGTPDYYDSRTEPLSHTFRDPGGIWAEGGPAFMTSRTHDVDEAIAAAIRVGSVVSLVGNAFLSALGEAIATGLLTGSASVDPDNWIVQGLPARSVGHLRVMGGLLGSVSLNRNADQLLQNLTRRLDSLSIEPLLQDLAADANQTLRAANPNAPTITSSDLGQMSLFHLVEWLRGQGIVRFVRPPEEIARERLAAMQAPPPR
jgi:Domain of unknown function (DUF4157)